MVKKSSVSRERAERASKLRASGAPAKFYTVAQVAEMLAVSVRTVHRWIERGELPVHRLGGAVRISETDFKVFVALHRDD
jgi:excisionase family DNA binding protein